MQPKSPQVVLFVLVLSLSPFTVPAQETSRVIPFNNVATSLPPSSTQDVTVQLWDAATDGTQLFSVPNAKGTGPVGYANVMRRIVKPLAKRLGIRTAGWHSLRHVNSTIMDEKARAHGGAEGSTGSHGRTNNPDLHVRSCRRTTAGFAGGL